MAFLEHAGCRPPTLEVARPQRSEEVKRRSTSLMLFQQPLSGEPSLQDSFQSETPMNVCQELQCQSPLPRVHGATLE